MKFTWKSGRIALVLLASITVIGIVGASGTTHQGQSREEHLGCDPRITLAMCLREFGSSSPTSHLFHVLTQDVF